jgi:hypothetical protein
MRRCGTEKRDYRNQNAVAYFTFGGIVKNTQIRIFFGLITLLRTILGDTLFPPQSAHSWAVCGENFPAVLTGQPTLIAGCIAVLTVAHPSPWSRARLTVN